MTTTTPLPPLPVWTIGERMSKARDFAGLDQTDMARTLGISRRSITRYETADTPPPAILLAYAQVTGVPLWWLEGTEPPTENANDRRARGRARVTERERRMACSTLDFTRLAA
jgi:transcriptional regulator with XRE-family HTH domain